MKKEINLLPPDVQRLRVTRIYLLHIGHFLRYIIILALMQIVVLGSTYAVVMLVNRLVSTDAVEGALKQEKLYSKVQDANDLVLAIHDYRERYKGWTLLIPDVLKLLPKDIKLTSLQADSEANTMRIQGVYSEREQLIAFQRQIKILPWVSALDAPLSNFETGNNSQFSLLIYRK